MEERLNPELEMEGILLTMYDGRLNLCTQVVEEVKTYFQQIVFETIVHRNIKLSEAPSFGKTIIMHDAASRGSLNYLHLAREVLQKNKMTRLKQSEKIINLEEN